MFAEVDWLENLGHFAMAMYMLRPYIVAMAMYMLRPYIVRLYIVRQSVHLGLNFKVPKTQKGNLGPHESCSIK